MFIFKTIPISLYILILYFSTSIYSQDKPILCFTFDDGNPKDILNYNYLQWNGMILNQLKENNLQSILYVCGKNLDNEKGRQILETWDKAGHLIGNHTYHHLNYNKEEMTFQEYTNDIIKCDSVINRYKNNTKLFRAPFLKNGNTGAKRDSLIEWLKRTGYGNGYVTIDASDWYYNSVLIKFMKNNPGANTDKIKELYIEHLLDRAKYYDDLATEIFGRKIRHSLLLHHNLTSALFLGYLIKAFKERGWEIIDAKNALSDDIYKRKMAALPAGESIIWNIAKETGNYENKLRYPAEDSIYEEEKVKEAGL